MKKLIQSVFLGTMILTMLFGVDIWTEDFEDCGNTTNCGGTRYTSTNDFFETATDDDYFGRVNGNTLEYYLTNASTGFTINTNVTYSNFNGDYYYAGEDQDDTGALIGSPDGLDEKQITFTGINIEGATNLAFKGLFGSGENDGCTLSVYDGTDYIKVFYRVDGGSEVLGMRFSPDIECNIPGDVSNEPLYYDPNMDGDGGEGTLLSAVLDEFGFTIPGTGASLDLRIEIHMDAANEEVAFDYLRITSDTTLGNDDPAEVPNAFAISNVYPNPFNPSTTIAYNVPAREQLSLSVYNLNGERVQRLHNGIHEAGTFEIQWTATDQPSGVYFIRLESATQTAAQKVLLVK